MEEDRKQTIMVVEDEGIIRLATEGTLRRFGYDVVPVASGEAAVSRAAEGGIDLILMDIDLGKGMDGPEAAQRIMQRKPMPIVFLSSHSEREMVERVRGITRYGYVIKNSGDFVLRSSIEMAFELFDANVKLETELGVRRLAETALGDSERRFVLSTAGRRRRVGQRLVDAVSGGHARCSGRTSGSRRNHRTWRRRARRARRRCLA